MNILKRLKLNSIGFSHIEAVTAIVVVVAITAVGIKVLNPSHAAPLTTNTAAVETNAAAAGIHYVYGPNAAGISFAACVTGYRGNQVVDVFTNGRDGGGVYNLKFLIADSSHKNGTGWRWTSSTFSPTGATWHSINMNKSNYLSFGTSYYTSEGGPFVDWWGYARAGTLQQLGIGPFSC